MNTPAATPRGPWFWGALAVGWGIMAFGVVGGLTHADDTNPDQFARWVAGAALAHDALLAPAVCLVGLAVARFVPRTVRGVVQGGLVVSGVVALFAVPLVRRYGERPDNPTVLFRDYRPSLAIVLTAVWTVTAVLALVAVARARSPRGEEVRKPM